MLRDIVAGAPFILAAVLGTCAPCDARPGSGLALQARSEAASAVRLVDDAQTARVRPGPAKTTWDTYMYEGPGTQYVVLDEIDHGKSLTVVSCANGWCRVAFGRGRDGYLLAEVVANADGAKPDRDLLPQPADAMIAKPPGPCFDALLTEGNGGTAPTRFCQKPNQ